MDEIRIGLRGPNPGDRSFIMATWLKGQYFGNPYFRQIPQDLYFREYAEVIKKILFMKTIVCNVACDEANPDWIVGFSILSEDSIYWMHVKAPFRRRGVAKLLVAGHKITTVKALTKVGQTIAQNHDLTFNPF